ncbi:uncharacterized protein KQ657_003743 [Scheffersomyces spartinae]|uniref:RRM domain-containing protein n=1 Tax=Scheffersomyces spartinae TaxID=45513 RepID=A0A9P7VC96_9ASCO|nr:uncharacterized protein KQ657_003743 [Scheffersomyces spartinae]KAG7195217.1 hypothetical protein KQ657_003743 [Scheffersomyces spartinae]
MTSQENKRVVIQNRIYIGNVNYKVTEDELRDFFEGYKVTEVDIPFKEITRGADKIPYKKRLGFAFVQFEDDAEADRAIAEYSGKLFKHRVLYMKKAVPPPTEEEKQKKNEAYWAKQAKQKEANKAAKEASAEAKTQLKTEDDGTSKKTITKKTPTPKKKQGEKPSKSNATDNGEREKNTPPEGTPSKDTVFITNLNYRVTTKDLTHLFKELDFVWIHIPKQRVPHSSLNKRRFRAPWNKGIAFVKLADEESQKKAIAELNGHILNGRPIVVDIAVDTRASEDRNTPNPDSTLEMKESPAEASVEA